MKEKPPRKTTTTLRKMKRMKMIRKKRQTLKQKMRQKTMKKQKKSQLKRRMRRKWKRTTRKATKKTKRNRLRISQQNPLMPMGECVDLDDNQYFISPKIVQILSGSQMIRM
mmetsp:Transcript_10557/g.30642  ORF Transcript_10557/g.30642 Transcript_10557/m.30642 type:complete len:111 (+) Transcript_10557:649-981(+)